MIESTGSRVAWEKAVLLILIALFAVALTYNLPQSDYSLLPFMLPVVLAACYYGLPGGIAGAGAGTVVAGVIASRLGIPLIDTPFLLQCVLFFFVGVLFGSLAQTIVRVQEQLRRPALTDEVTGLYNYQHFRTRLDEEVKRAKRYGHPLSLMMCDINRFKKINETQGHANANFHLNKMATLIKESVRESDITFRYGGDEFAIILTETGVEARDVARRIVDYINGSFAGRDKSGDSLEPSLSVGVAVRDRESPLSTSLLIAFADQALYQAKRNGTNIEFFSLGDKLPSRE